MEITGMVVAIDEPRQVSEKMKVQEFILDTSYYEQGTGKRFENYAKLQVVNNRLNQLMGISLNDRVLVSFSINGRTYEKDGKKLFGQNLNAFKITKL